MNWRAIAVVVVLSGCGSSSEPAPIETLQHPFGAHRDSYAAGTILPARTQAELDDATRGFYDAWKQHYLVFGCGDERAYVFVRADGEGGGGRDDDSISISEGHGYGMIAAVLMAGHDPEAQRVFDALFRYYRDHPSVNDPALMGWNQIDGCGPSIANAGDDSATDGDLDIAHALLLADAQWGSGGAIDYRSAALGVIAAIAAHELHPSANLPQLGDWVDPEETLTYDAVRPSDLMIDHFRAFAAASGEPRWSAAVEASYALLESVHDAATGLVPDFVVDVVGTPTPAQPNFLEDVTDGAYGYNACRVPWRLASDGVLSGDPRARELLDPIIAWTVSSTAGEPAAIVDGYTLTGDPIGSGQSLAFTAPLAVGAMFDGSHQAWLDVSWDRLVARELGDDEYYGNTLKLLALIVLSGNAWAP
jgi:endo-1,4-beta-D-glucanase Y